jgi:hypothetical protein
MLRDALPSEIAWLKLVRRSNGFGYNADKNNDSYLFESVADPPFAVAAGAL